MNIVEVRFPMSGFKRMPEIAIRIWDLGDAITKEARYLAVLQNRDNNYIDYDDEARAHYSELKDKVSGSRTKIIGMFLGAARDALTVIPKVAIGFVGEEQKINFHPAQIAEIRYSITSLDLRGPVHTSIRVFRAERDDLSGPGTQIIHVS